MSSIIQFMLILTLFFFLHYSIISIGVVFQTPTAPIDKIAIQDHDHDQSHIHLVSQYSTHLAPKPRKLAFGHVNTVANVVVIVITILNIVVYKLREIHEANLREKYTPSEQLCRRFLLADVLLATKNFDDSLVVGQGGFGKVYRGVIDDGTITVAIKRLNPISKQGAPEFWAEIEMLSKVRHSNIVSLIGYCNDCDEMILVYEYMIHGTLADNMHRNGDKSNLPWVQRLKICIGAARGLDYLHTGTGDRSRIIHRDVKSSNILLGENWTAKISDFGLSKIGPTNQLNTHVSTNVKGTFGYVDPEYFLFHKLTRKSDVYAFGVVLFEVLCGRRAVDLRLDEEQRGLAGWAQQCMKEGKVDQIIDPSLRGEILSDSLTEFAQIADKCLHMFSTERPTMAEVVVALELALTLQERTDFSILEGEFFNTGGDFHNQENAESSIKEEAFINGACNNQENADSSMIEQVVINANYDLRHNEQTEGITQFDGVNNKESHVKPARIMALTKIVRQLFSGTGLVILAHSVAKPSKNSKSNNNNGENITLSSKDGDIVWHVPLSGHNEDPNFKMFTYAELIAATWNFEADMVLGGGRFGMVFKGWVDEKTLEPSQVDRGVTITVKEIDQTSLEIRVGRKLKLETEVEFWGKFSHPNLVKNLGYCSEGYRFFLVREYMQGSLEGHLFGFFQKRLPWVTRLKIAIEAARGLAFLHTSGKKVIYRRLKTSNILLDGDFNAKLSGFELSDLEIEDYVVDIDFPDRKFPTITPETKARAAPEYIAEGYLSLKSVRVRACDPPGISEVREVWGAGGPSGPFVPFCVHLCVSLSCSRCREDSIFQSRQYVLRENGQKMVCKGKGYRQAYLLHVCLRNHDSREFGNYVTDWEGIRHPLRPYGL